jgi:hypothetical protein
MISLPERIPAVLEALLAGQPLTPAKVEFAWKLSVGPALARATQVTCDPDGTVRVRTASAHWQREVRRAAPLIESRLGRLLGAGTVRRIDVEPR